MYLHVEEIRIRSLFLGWRFGVLRLGVCIGSVPRRQSICTYDMEDPRRLCQWRHILDCADARWLPLAGHRVGNLSLRWITGYSLATRGRSAPSAGQYLQSACYAQWSALDRHAWGPCKLDRHQIYALSGT